MEGGLNDFRRATYLTDQDDWVDQYVDFIEKASRSSLVRRFPDLDGRACVPVARILHVRGLMMDVQYTSQ